MNYSPFDIKLFSLFANKELTEGCIFEWNPVTVKYQGYWKVAGVTDRKRFSCYKLDGQLIEDVNLFQEDTISDGILGHEPTITDVFRVAKEKGMIAFTRYNTAEREYLGLEFDKELSDYRDVIETYDITLSLLEQEDSTKEELIKLFS